MNETNVYGVLNPLNVRTEVVLLPIEIQDGGMVLKGRGGGVTLLGGGAGAVTSDAQNVQSHPDTTVSQADLIVMLLALLVGS
jgi:hypothetical protein